MGTETPFGMSYQQILWVYENPLKTSVVDPNSFNPDPAFQENSDPDPGFVPQKLKKKKLQLKLYVIFFCSKISIYISLGLQKVRPKLKEKPSAFKTDIKDFKK
jgi:hypothetical protein